MVYGHAERSANGILTAIALADRVFLVILAVEVEPKIIDNLACLFGQSVFLYQWHNGQFDRRKGCGQLEHYAGFAIFECLLLISMTHDGEEHTVNTDTCLDDIRSITLIGLWIEIFDALARKFLMLRKIEIGTAVYALHLFKSEWHLEFDVGGSIGIVSQFLMVMETVVLGSESQCLMPCHTSLLPFRKPVKFGARLYKELHLHLLKLPHSEYELACHNFITESLAYLCYAERNLHASRFLHIEIVYKDTLRCFRTEVYLHGSIGRSTHLCREHKIELAHICPVFGAAYGVNDFLVYDYLL